LDIIKRRAGTAVLFILMIAVLMILTGCITFEPYGLTANPEESSSSPSSSEEITETAEVITTTEQEVTTTIEQEDIDENIDADENEDIDSDIDDGDGEIADTPPVEPPVEPPEEIPVIPEEKFAVSFKSNYDQSDDNTIIMRNADKDEPLGTQMPDDPPQRDGWKFTGWNIRADGKGIIFDKDTPVDKEMTVYAIWEKESGFPLVLIILIVAVSLIIAGGLVIAGGRFYYKNKKNRKKKINNRPSVQQHINRPGNSGVGVSNIQGIGSRANQQDSFGITEIDNLRKGIFAVVADGMGGTSNGAEISRITTSRMLQLFRDASPDFNDPGGMLLSMLNSSQESARAFIKQIGGQISGSTVVAAIIKRGSLWFVSVGDSRIYLLRGGELIQLNREHNCASDLDEQAARGEITLEEALNDPKRAALTSFIGIESNLQIDRNVQPIKLANGDRVLIMSDGVFGTISEAELAETASTAEVQKAGTVIEQKIKEKAKPNQDNYTAIILEIFGIPANTGNISTTTTMSSRK